MIEQITIENGYFHDIRTFLEIPQGEGPFPTVIICHGLTANPAYPVDTHPIYKQLSEDLVNVGFLTVRFNFTMNIEKDVSTFHIKSELHDLNTVMDALKDEDRVDNKKIGLAGHSFGATAVLLAAHKERKVKAVAALAPKIELGDEYGSHPWHQEAQEKGYFTHVDHTNTERKISKDFLEHNFKHNKKLKRAIKKIHKPLLVMYGTLDDTDKAEGEMVRDYAKHATIKEVEGADHNFSSPTSLVYVTRECTNFFTEHLL